MGFSAGFFVNSILLGAGLAMDAFSVSIANGLNEPEMKNGKRCGIAGTFAAFQMIMPLFGWFCVHTIAEYFTAFEKIIPWIALMLLGFIGGKMIIEAVKNDKEENAEKKYTTFGVLMLQGLATSIDALSVGFAISDYNGLMALVCSLIIAVVTFGLCMLGLFAGNKIGEKLAGRAGLLGGIILVGIGLEIFISSFVK